VKVGDLVRYRGWSKIEDAAPLGLVVDETSSDSEFHHRIRVAWIGEKIPVQASVLSTRGGRVTSWVRPSHFEIVNDLYNLN